MCHGTPARDDGHCPGVPYFAGPATCQGCAALAAVWLAVRMKKPGGPLDWDGAVNAWHVAGHVYRMGRREWLTAAGWRTAYDDGVRTVVDLRNSHEARRRDTDPAVTEAAWSGIRLVSAPTEDPDDPRFIAVCGPYLNDPAHYVHNVRLFPAKLVEVFRTIAEAAPAGGVVVHCAAGRDRSGMVAAMLQDLAGDTDEQIAAGYARAARAINERYRTHGPPHDRERYIGETELAPLLEERGHTVVAFVRDLDTEDFLLRHGLTAAELIAVRSVLGATVTR